MLPKRLQFLASFYNNEKIIYDLACDHAKLGIHLAELPSTSEVHLVDCSEKVYMGLLQTLSGLNKNIGVKLHPHLSEAQNINFLDQSLIYLTGIGGRLALEILNSIAQQNLNNIRVIVCPHQDIFEFRDKLSQTSWGLLSEHVLSDNDQFYQVLNLSLKEGSPVHPFGQFWEKEEAQNYLLHIRQFYQVHRDTISLNLMAYLSKLKSWSK